MTFSLSCRDQPCHSSPLLPVKGHILGNNHARHVFLHLLVPCLLGVPSSSGTRYCQIHHSAGDVVRISSLDMSKPTKMATAQFLVNRCKLSYASNFFVLNVFPSCMVWDDFNALLPCCVWSKATVNIRELCVIRSGLILSPCTNLQLNLWTFSTLFINWFQYRECSSEGHIYVNSGHAVVECPLWTSVPGICPCHGMPYVYWAPGITWHFVIVYNKLYVFLLSTILFKCFITSLTWTNLFWWF